MSVFRRISVVDRDNAPQIDRDSTRLMSKSCFGEMNSEKSGNSLVSGSEPCNIGGYESVHVNVYVASVNSNKF